MIEISLKSAKDNGIDVANFSKIEIRYHDVEANNIVANGKTYIPLIDRGADGNIDLVPVAVLSELACKVETLSKGDRVYCKGDPDHPWEIPQHCVRSLDYKAVRWAKYGNNGTYYPFSVCPFDEIRLHVPNGRGVTYAVPVSFDELLSILM